MSACEIDWGLTADLISALAAIATFGVALWAAASWREQLRGGSKHAVAQEVATAARSLSYAFYGARSPMIEGWEFPERYWTRDGGRSRTNTEEGEAYAHVYRRRIQELWPSIMAVAGLRAKAGAVLAEDVSENLEGLAKKARELQFYFEQRVRQIQSGPESVKQWSDQNYVAKVNSSVVVHDPPDDAFSKEFEELLTRLLERVKPYL